MVWYIIASRRASPPARRPAPVRANYYTPEITKVKFHWKLQLTIFWTTPVKIHWKHDNPLEHATGK